jgi:hypothetical protein
MVQLLLVMERRRAFGELVVLVQNAVGWSVGQRPHRGKGNLLKLNFSRHH